MRLFEGFEEILKCVIENTACPKSDACDEERYHNAMKAIFGKTQPNEFLKPPRPKTMEADQQYCEISYADMLWINTMKKHGTPLETAIKKKVAFLLPMPQKPEDTSDDAEKEKQEDQYWAAYHDIETERKKAFDRIKRQFDEKKEHYAQAPLLWLKEEPPSESEIIDIIAEYELEQEEIKQKIFQALRHAGWPI